MYIYIKKKKEKKVMGPNFRLVSFGFGVLLSGFNDKRASHLTPGLYSIVAACSLRVVDIAFFLLKTC